jgi:hypothetical protein
MGSSNGSSSGSSPLNNLLSSSSSPLPGQNSTAWNNGQQGNNVQQIGQSQIGTGMSNVGQLAGMSSTGMPGMSGGMQAPPSLNQNNSLQTILAQLMGPQRPQFVPGGNSQQSISRQM